VGTVPSEHSLYLTTLRCDECGNRTTYAHEGANVPIDQEAPWPDDVKLCSECGYYYPDDLGLVIDEIANAERVDPHSLEADSDRDGGNP
jgi:hypothetical protein